LRLPLTTMAGSLRRVQ